MRRCHITLYAAASAARMFAQVNSMFGVRINVYTRRQQAERHMRMSRVVREDVHKQPASCALSMRRATPPTSTAFNNRQRTGASITDGSSNAHHNAR